MTEHKSARERLSQADRDELAAGEKWKALAAKTGWTVYGWTGPHSALFMRDGRQLPITQDHVAMIEAAERSAIEQAAKVECANCRAGVPFAPKEPRCHTKNGVPVICEAQAIRSLLT